MNPNCDNTSMATTNSWTENVVLRFRLSVTLNSDIFLLLLQEQAYKYKKLKHLLKSLQRRYKFWTSFEQNSQRIATSNRMIWRAITDLFPK